MIAILVIGSLFCMTCETFAESGSSLVQKFDGTNRANTTNGENLITKIVGPILSVIRIVAIGIGMIMITYLGIKYMAAAPNEKAAIKNQLITFAIGVTVVVATTTILGIIRDAVTAITTAPPT